MTLKPGVMMLKYFLQYIQIENCYLKCKKYFTVLLFTVLFLFFFSLKTSFKKVYIYYGIPNCIMALNIMPYIFNGI